MVYLEIYVGIYIHKCMHVTTINKKEATNLNERARKGIWEGLEEGMRRNYVIILKFPK